MIIIMHLYYLLLSCNSKQILKSCLSTSEQNLSWIITLKNLLQKWQWVILKEGSVSSSVYFCACNPLHNHGWRGLRAHQNTHGWRPNLFRRGAPVLLKKQNNTQGTRNNLKTTFTSPPFLAPWSEICTCYALVYGLLTKIYQQIKRSPTSLVL